MTPRLPLDERRDAQRVQDGLGRRPRRPQEAFKMARWGPRCFSKGPRASGWHAGQLAWEGALLPRPAGASSALMLGRWPACALRACAFGCCLGVASMPLGEVAAVIGEPSDELTSGLPLSRPARPPMCARRRAMQAATSAPGLRRRLSPPTSVSAEAPRAGLAQASRVVCARLARCFPLLAHNRPPLLQLESGMLCISSLCSLGAHAAHIE
ncbi:unnamed protein product [Prorocentrum cordatum]|uniref:Uncharacterized protein n=1 Tax=Prorocentrum cordatum TaxID=2364126 RepID=A0ABN9VDQ9_9DINO|nr:unnamed protein product [Polarella glacialis]